MNLPALITIFDLLVMSAAFGSLACIFRRKWLVAASVVFFLGATAAVVALLCGVK